MQAQTLKCNTFLFGFTKKLFFFSTSRTNLSKRTEQHIDDESIRRTPNSISCFSFLFQSLFFSFAFYAFYKSILIRWLQTIFHFFLSFRVINYLLYFIITIEKEVLLCIIRLFGIVCFPLFTHFIFILLFSSLNGIRTQINLNK